MQLLRGDLRRGALRADAPADVAARCACREQAEPGCHIYTEAWPASPAWLDGAPLASAELTPCPAAPHFRMQFFHTYHDWTHEASTRDTMALVRARPCKTEEKGRPASPACLCKLGAAARALPACCRGAVHTGALFRASWCRRDLLPAYQPAEAVSSGAVRCARWPRCGRRCAAPCASGRAAWWSWRARPRTSIASARASLGRGWMRASACGT